ncbi:MAG: hypothetical protein EZS28_054479, partial [Streblomastix strix]
MIEHNPPPDPTLPQLSHSMNSTQSDIYINEPIPDISVQIPPPFPDLHMHPLRVVFLMLNLPQLVINAQKPPPFSLLQHQFNYISSYNLGLELVSDISVVIAPPFS